MRHTKKTKRRSYLEKLQ